MIDGDFFDKEIILVDKPAGWTSFDVVAKLRGYLKLRYREQGTTPTKRQIKVGHAGTLDPFATGLLIILLRDGTKKASEYLKLDKTYEATIHLGSISTTGDTEGEIRSVSAYQPTEAEIETVLRQLTGTITQVPPAYSAIKINGQRAYKRARLGQAVDIPSRRVTIYSLTLQSYAYPYLSIQTHVSSGTYIRSLSEDIGRLLKVGAYTEQLRRTTIGEFSINNAMTLDAL